MTTTVSLIVLAAAWVIVLILGVATRPGRAALKRFTVSTFLLRRPRPAHRATRKERVS